MAADRYRVTRHRAIGELPERDWDALAGGNFYLSHRWLRVVERDSQPPPVYLAAWSPGGALAGGLPVYRLQEAPGNQLADPAFAVAGRPGASGWYPALLGGARIGYANGIGVGARLPAAAQADVCAALLDALAGYADDGGFASSSLLYLNQAGASQVSASRAGAARAGGAPGWPLVLSSAEAVLPVSWSSFEEYLAALSRHRRANVRADLRNFARSGLQARLVPLGEVAGDAAPLAVNVQHKYGHRSSTERQVRFFGDCAGLLGEDALVFGCFDGGSGGGASAGSGGGSGGRLIGFGLAFRWRDTLYIRSAGFDYDALPRLGEHFTVMYYEPIRYAISRGLAMVHFGTESFAAKVARGCSLRPLWSAARRREPFSGDELRRLEEVSRARLRGWDDDLAAALGYLPSEAWASPADNSPAARR